MRSEAPSRDSCVGEVPAALIGSAMAGGGVPLSSADRDFFEPRFGQNLEHIRIHDNAQTRLLARTLETPAFTVGSDLFVGAGTFARDPRTNRRLLARDSTHPPARRRPADPPFSATRVLHTRRDERSPKIRGKREVGSPANRSALHRREDWGRLPARDGIDRRRCSTRIPSNGDQGCSQRRLLRRDPSLG